MINKYQKYQKIFASLLLGLLISTYVAPLAVFAATDTVNNLDTNPDPNAVTTYNLDYPPAEAGTQGIDQKSSTDANKGKGTGDLATNILTTAGTCSVGAILGRLLSNLIAQAISEISTTLTSLITSEAEAFLKSQATSTVYPEVPTKDRETRLNTQNDAKNTAKLRQKSVGGAAGGGFLSGILDITDISLDSVMFCIINEIISYITQSTINWINTGFKGNPVFVQNPGALFQNIANQEASNFITSVQRGTQYGANGLAVQTANGINSMFMPLRQGVAQNLVGYYNNSMPTSAMGGLPSPTISEAQYNALWNGRSTDWMTYSQRWNPANTVYGRTAFYEGPRMMQQIQFAQNSANQKYIAGNGYLDFTTCPAGATRPDGSCDPRQLLTVVGGHQIDMEANARNLTKYMRISMANSFDSVITALVNQLIKIAVNKIFEGEQKVNGQTQGR